eukprot:1640806-Pyramimonas_sp.AAC.1
MSASSPSCVRVSEAAHPSQNGARLGRHPDGDVHEEGGRVEEVGGGGRRVRSASVLLRLLRHCATMLRLCQGGGHRQLHAARVRPRQRQPQRTDLHPGYPDSVLGYPDSVLGNPGSVLGYPGSVMGYPDSVLGYPGSAHRPAHRTSSPC